MELNTRNKYCIKERHKNGKFMIASERNATSLGVGK